MSIILLRNESMHLIVSLLIGFVFWKKYKNPWAIGIALLGGFFVDVDHLIDYFLVFGFHFDLMSFLGGDQFLKSDKLYLLFHGWEYVILILLFLVFVKNKIFKIIMLIFAVSLFFHLIIDSFSNDGMTIKSYSLIYRARNSFNIDYY